MPSLERTGDLAYTKIDKINSELLTLTYGALVTQILKDYEDAEQTNIQLDKMGYSMGLRLIEEFLAKTQLSNPCRTFRDAADTISKVGFRMFLGISDVKVEGWNQDNTEFSLIIPPKQNPLEDFVELPLQYRNKLWYSNLLCGVIRGALEMVQMRVKCSCIKCPLRGDSHLEIRVVLEEMLQDPVPQDDD
eukprot:gb/GECH01009533.1/.p1 GENE.gb/GECH01009533.1/~~gb/GECH01009533.1/.p1  ORF type:complete len:190 (+),score=29.09 gb/GECH01009533.1/:1-570(+)